MKYLIKYNYGYGDEYDVVDAETEEAASEIAYEMWKDGAESQAEYSANILTRELAEDHGFENELDNTKEGQDNAS